MKPLFATFARISALLLALATTQGLAQTTPQTPAAQASTLSAAGAPLAKLYAELSALEDNKARTPVQDTRLKTLRGEMEQASAAFQKVLDQVLIELSSTRSDKANDVQEAQGLQNTLRELSDKSGENVVALYTVVDKDAYSLILVTADYRRAYTVPIKAEDLNTKIVAYRNTVQNPKLDPTAQARELLNVVLPPAARQELEQANARTLMWSLDGALRLLPLAALHDGEQYLMQRYRLATFTPVGTAGLLDTPKAHWTALGLGVSEGRSVNEGTAQQRSFSALPAVAQELASVIRQGQGQGALPGSSYLNQAFSWATVQEELKRKGKYSVIHIASHCNLEPGNDTMGYLLPGAGEPITLAQLIRQSNLFGGVDLLTLSACETAVGGGKGANGVEVDGLSSIAQRQGAKAVMATLWPVADASTALLMERFYRLRESGKLTKAEALRQAQLTLLTGNAAAVAGDASARGARAVGSGTAGEGTKAAFVTDPKAPYAHPYYWAPFVLMGNWL